MEPQEEARAMVLAEEKHLIGGDVLVVDDEPTVRDFMGRVFRRNGFECRTASDAGQAMAMFLDRPPSLAVTDIRMPGQDGLWLLRELRKRWPLTPVIVLTAFSDGQQAVDCLRAGAQDYLMKPIEIPDLLASIRRALWPAARWRPDR